MYQKLLTGFGKLSFFTNLSHGISGQVFGLVSSFLSKKRLRMVLNDKFPQEYLVNVEVSQGSILGPTFFLLYTNDLPYDFICNTAIYANDTTIYSKCDQASDYSNNKNWLLILNLMYKKLWTGAGSGFLISVLENSAGFI